MAKKKKKRWIPITISAVLVVALVVGGVVYFTGKSSEGATGNSTRTFQTQEVKKDELSVDVSGNGTLSPAESETISSSYSGTVTSVKKKVGDTVKSGEIIATVESDELDNQIKSLQDKLDDVEVQIAGTDTTSSSKYINSQVSGNVKSVKAQSGEVAEDVVNDHGYLCLISTDGKMKVSFTSSKTLKKYASVTVKIGSSSETGTVTSVNGKDVVVEIDDNSYTIGKTAKVYTTGGTSLGSGKLQLVDYVKVKDTDGKISSVLVSENESVSSGSNLFKLADYKTNSTYQTLKSQKEELESQLEDLNQQKNVSVDFNGTIADLPISKGDTVNKESTLCTVNGKKGFTLAVDVDELDIASVKLGDEAKIKLDAIDGDYTGKVSYISNVGNTENSVTTYSVKITTDAIEGAMSGMNATATITTESSGESLVVPVSAVQTQGSESFIYLAPDGSQKGDEVEQSSVNKENLTKVTVKTGMSDGSFIVVEADKLSEGTLIYVPVVTTNSDSSSSSSDDRMKQKMENMQSGGFPGGSAPSGERPSGGFSGGSSSKGN